MTTQHATTATACQNSGINICELYRKAAQAGLVSHPDVNAYVRAKRAFKRNITEPGDCAGDIALLAGLAIAQADLGIRPGWIPAVQAIGCKIAKLREQSSHA